MRTSRRVEVLTILGGVLVAYHNAIGGAFQFDDFNVIVENPAVHTPGGWLTDAPHGIRPLLKLSYLINWIVAGPGPFGFHVFNVAVHAANAILVYCLSRRVFCPEPGPADAGPAVGPWFTSLLFAVHPVHTEAVTYVSGRSMSLMAFFYLGSLLTYVRGVETGSRFRLFAASPALFLAAALTKEVALTLPAALLLWEARRDPLGGRWSGIARRQAVHWILFFSSLFLLVWHPGYRTLLGSALAARAVGENLLSQVHGVGYLLSRMVWVHRLNIDPELPVLAAWSPAVGAEALLFLCAFVAALVRFRKSPVLGFGILWFLLQMLPANSVIPRLDVANERHLYLASWGIFLCAGAAVGRARQGRAFWARGLLAGALAMGILLAGFTVHRNRAYRSEVALWEETVRRSPGSARAYNNLGYAYQLAGMPDEAARCYRESLRLDAGFRIARGNLETLEKKREQEQAFPTRGGKTTR